MIVCYIMALHSLSTIERYDKSDCFYFLYFKETPFSCQFCIRLSPTVTAASNMGKGFRN
uniref:Uncharacterized protein n=1 Tax=Vitis vinifera TaxID=29760 RepID=F6HGG2_VITVI